MSCPVCKAKHPATIKASPMLTNGRVLLYAICKACGVAYHEPPMTPEEYVAYNEAGWDKNVLYCSAEESMRRSGGQFAALREILQPGDSIFDIGTADGSVVKLCRDAGFHAEGNEPTVGARAAAKERHGLDIPVGLPDANFNIVCLFSVMEHVLDGERLIRDALNILAPGGTLVIKMPAFNFQGQGWWGYEAEHPCVYTRQATGNLVARLGFKEARHWTEGERAIYIFEEDS